jgi:UDP-N-acetyl-D-glucosamine/UDP-N-acetyl-D-galactosamine dehydrogenase
MKERVCVIGLGYVGLPLAVALARHHDVIGFDVNPRRIEELRTGVDRTHEVSADVLASADISFTTDLAAIRGFSIYIVTVPTPVDARNRPDLSLVRSASELVGKVIDKGAVMVLESTVYPGVTEEVCGPVIERASGLVCGRDFFLGYSPERINPGDREHTVSRITKVVAGQTPDIARRLAALYGAITSGGAFVARDIRTAEAAKVIENAQRDINIAFINEVTMIFNRMGLSIFDVVDAARTKWNFLPFTPGLVGGHCIGVDPFYLADCAQRLGQNPEVILAGRRINDGMGSYIAGAISGALAATKKTHPARILVLGLTFKENVPDLRNSKVADVIEGLSGVGHRVDVHDPFADHDDARHEYGVDLISSLVGAVPYDCVVAAVPHDVFRSMTVGQIEALVVPNGVVADIKGIWRTMELAPGIARWQL